MRFLKVSAYYLDFVRLATNRDPQIADRPFSDQMTFFFSFDFGWSDYWKRHLESGMRMEVTEIVYNIASAQKKWAAENSVVYGNEDWQNQILDAQIAHYRPEIIFFEDQLRPPSYYKKRFPFIRFIISWDGLALKDPLRYESTDMIASCHEGTVEFYKAKNIPTYHFRFGFETSVLDKLDKRPPRYDVSFVGSLNIHKNGHLKRLELLSALNKSVDTQYWISGATHIPLLSKQMAKNLVRGVARESLQLNRLLASSRGQAFGREMYQILADSRVTINNHIDAAGAFAANIRLYEATGVGACLVTDWKENLSEIFDLDKEVVAYRSAGECVEKIKGLLNNEGMRKSIAAAGQKRVLEHYSLRDRIITFMKTISF